MKTKLNKSLIKGIIRLEELRFISSEARLSIGRNNHTSWTEKDADKAQIKFEKYYFTLVNKFRELGEDASNYTQWETISPLEFMQEVNNK